MNRLRMVWDAGAREVASIEAAMNEGRRLKLAAFEVQEFDRGKWSMLGYWTRERPHHLVSPARQVTGAK